jgi:hypothetical protein
MMRVAVDLDNLRADITRQRPDIQEPGVWLHADTIWEMIEEIAAARAAGMKLLNVADGGDQPFCSKEIRAENGRRNAIARVNTPIKAMAFDLKRKIGMMLVRGELKDRHIEKMRIAAHKCPELFGAWAAL